MTRIRDMAIVCFEDPRRITGGVQRRVGAEIAHFAAQGVRLHVIAEGPAGQVDTGTVRYITIPAPRVPYPLRTLLFSRGAALYLSALGQLDVVEAHHDAGAAPLLAYRLRPDRHTVFAEVIHGVFRDELAALRRHEGLFSRSMVTAAGLWPLSFVEQLAARRATVTVAVSNYGADLVASRYGVPRDRIYVVPNGVTLPSSSRHARGGGGLDKTVSFLYVGRLHARKGVLPLVNAFGAAQAQDDRLDLTIVGDGPLRTALELRCTELGIGHAVRFAGTVGDEALGAFYHNADVLVMPSLQEGQGIVALEAQAHGLPVVATRAGGVGEVVKDGSTGLLVPPGNVDAFAAAMLRLAADSVRRAESGRSAAAWARSFAWERVLGRHEAILAEALDRRSGVLGQPRRGWPPLGAANAPVSVQEGTTWR